MSFIDETWTRNIMHTDPRGRGVWLDSKTWEDLKSCGARNITWDTMQQSSMIFTTSAALMLGLMAAPIDGDAVARR